MRRLTLGCCLVLLLLTIRVPEGWAGPTPPNPKPTTTFKTTDKEVKANFTRPSNLITTKRGASQSKSVIPPRETPIRPSQPSRLQQCIAAARKKAAATRTPSLEQLCFTPLVGAEAPPAAPPVDFVQLARSLSVRLRLPDTNPRFGPDPQANEWKMLAVGYPVWLWVDGPTTRTATASASGFTFHLVATRTGTTFDLGDGHTLRCATTTPYSSSVKPGTPSPTCGHIYAKPSTPGRYTVTATAEWQVRWSVDGLSGSFPMRYSDTSTLTIGELQALVR